MGSRVVFVGPFPPPTHGQSNVTAKLADALESVGIDLRRIDVSLGGGARGKLVGHAKAAFELLRGRGGCYLSVNSNAGMFLTAVLAAVARVRCDSIVLHHHAYDQAKRRKLAVAALCRAAGKDAVHLALSEVMATDLKRVNPEMRRVHVVDNAGFVPRAEVPCRRPKSSQITLGHMSNLTETKGIGRVVDAAGDLLRRGEDVRLIVAGPIHDTFAEKQLARASAELGLKFEYRGPVYGPEKSRFFSDVDVFLFPSLYLHEAAPMVILEAMSYGVPTVAFSIGCIEDQIGRTAGRAISTEADFSAGVQEYIREYSPHSSRQFALDRFKALQEKHSAELAALARILGADIHAASRYIEV